MSGMLQSVITTAGWCSANRSRASPPFFANRTSYSCPKRECSTSLREIAESSTARTVKGWEEGFMVPILSLTVVIQQSSASRNCSATNSGSVSSSFCDNQTCSSDFCSSEIDTKRIPKLPVFDQQIVDSAKNGAS